jgi:hypothetical protein
MSPSGERVILSSLEGMMARINRGDLVMVGFYVLKGEPYDYWVATSRGGAYWVVTSAASGTSMMVHRDSLTKVEKK